MPAEVYLTAHARMNRQQWRTLIDFFDGDESKRDDALDVVNLIAPREWRAELDGLPDVPA